VLLFQTFDLHPNALVSADGLRQSSTLLAS